MNLKKFFGNKIAISLFTLPALLIFTVMIFSPILQVFYNSFFKWDGINEGVFIGIKNYTRLFDDKVFMISTKNSIKFAAVITFFQMGLATVFALAVSNAKTKGRKFLRIVYFIPVVLSVTVVCQLWLSIYNADTGLLNQFLKLIGSNYKQNWLTDRNNSIYAIATVNAWQWMGYQFALIVAGIKSIPNDYYEAAQIDGASTIKSHLKVTIPLLSETYKLCLIVSITGGIKAFTEMYIMTSGGPGTSTYTLTYMMYSAAFRSGEYGYGLAAASILVIQCLLVIVLVNRIFRDKDTIKMKGRKIG